MVKLNLAPEKEREYFLRAYASWDLVHEETVYKFEYFHYRFESGDRLIALRYKTDSKVGVGIIIILVPVRRTYAPIASPKLYIYNYLTALHHEQMVKEGYSE